MDHPSAPGQPGSGPQATPPPGQDTPSGLPFDRRAPNESNRHYAMFAAWRDLGPGRTVKGEATLDAVAVPNGGKRPDERNLRRLMKRWHWQERAQAWDAHLDAERVAAQVEANVLLDVEGYRDRQQKLGKVMLEATIRLVTLANGRLAELKPGDLRPQDVPRFFEVATKVAAAASSAEAQAIGLKELVGVLAEQQERSGWGSPAGATVGSAPRAEA